MLKIYDFTVEHEFSPMATPVKGARFGWKLNSTENDVFQTSYQLIIKDGSGLTAYDSGKVESDNCTEVTPDVTLKTGERYTATVKVTDNKGECAECLTSFDTEILPDEWTGKWIKPKKHYESWAPYIRKKFETSKKISRAILYASGLGCAEYYINGKKISEDYIDPPMTNYEREVFYRAYDVTGFLSDKNCFAALLGDGWYSQSRVWAPQAFKYGDVCLCAEIRIKYDDGTQDIIATDESWKYKYSPITINNLYGGEMYDTRLETPDFADYDGDEDEWGDCRLDTTPKGALKGCVMPPVRIIEKIPAKSVTNASGKDDGAWIIDMGENFAGFAEFHIRNSPRGAQYVFRFAETLNQGGELDFRSIGSFATQCIQQDIYIARGDKDGEVWRPRFTYHAFRYIEITGYHDLRKYGSNPDIEIAVGYKLSTDLRKTGSFVSDNTDLNNLQRVMMGTFRSNYHGFPEDCPGREKCGWLGDAQVVCNTGMMNYDMRSSYEKYLHDIRTETEVYGTWQMISPGKRGCGEASPLWGCAQIIIPYWMYKYYGDKRAVTDNFDMMEKWVQHEINRAPDYIISEGLGDWCPPCGNEGKTRMPVKHSSSMMFFEICKKMSELCQEFGYGPEKVKYYLDLAEASRESLIRNFYDKEKHTYGYWGSNGVALTLGIYPDGDKEALLSETVAEIRADDHEMPTGIYANKYLIPVLCENGYGDDALKYMFTRKHISFGTMLDDNGTSLWECLEMKHIQTDRAKGVPSYNHPMHSGFAYFYYSEIAGIKPLEPGFRKFKVNPAYFSDINKVDVTYDTPYGNIAVKFEKNGKTANYEITVPANTECMFAPIGSKDYTRLTSGKYTFKA